MGSRLTAGPKSFASVFWLPSEAFAKTRELRNHYNVDENIFISNTTNLICHPLIRKSTIGRVYLMFVVVVVLLCVVACFKSELTRQLFSSLCFVFLVVFERSSSVGRRRRHSRKNMYLYCCSTRSTVCTSSTTHERCRCSMFTVLVPRATSDERCHLSSSSSCTTVL